MIKFNKDNDVLIAMRSAAWRRAKVELMCVIDTINTDTNYEQCIHNALVNRIEDFVVDFIDVMNEEEEEDGGTPGNRQNAIDFGSSNDESPKVNAIEWRTDRLNPIAHDCDRRCVGETPIGQFLICWKFRPTSVLIEHVIGSNEDFTVKQSPIGSIDVSGEDGLQGVKDCCQKEYELHILRCLMSQELPI